MLGSLVIVVTNMDSILTVRHLSAGYDTKQVLFDVNVDVLRGEFLVVTGGNGSGKSTLLKSIYGIICPWNQDAEIVFRPDTGGPPLRTTPPSENLRHGLAYLPQKNAVFDGLTVEDNLRISGDSLRKRNEFAVRRDEVLSFLPMLQPLLRRKPEQTSGGERQLVGLAMLLIHRPKLLLLDEPLVGLANDPSEIVLKILRTRCELFGTSVVLVEHRIGDVACLAHRIVNLRLGRIEPSESIRQVSLSLTFSTLDCRGSK